MKNRFNIDFFEFCFLVEACIPPAPIARTMFFQKVIDIYYHEMTKEERRDLYKWLNDNHSFQNSLKMNDELCFKFNARFDNDNEYEVNGEKDGIIDGMNCFKFCGKYWINSTTNINEEYIIEINKIEV